MNTDGNGFSRIKDNSYLLSVRIRSHPCSSVAPLSLLEPSPGGLVAQFRGGIDQLEELLAVAVAVLAQRRGCPLPDAARGGRATMLRLAQHHAERRHRRREANVGRGG